MTDINIRTEGRAGRITFTRPKSLNALSPPMAVAIEQALDAWRTDPSVALIIIDAEGERAFCAGGDVAEIYHKGRAGDHDHGRRFWRQEYRMNAKIAGYPKPVVSLMQGFTMGGGVGVGCHTSHRVVGESSQIAMPECGIGLIPDVGGTLLLARAPGQTGRYLGLTAGRMGPGDALFAGFADHFIPEADWPALIAVLTDSGDPAAVAAAAKEAPESPLAARAAQIDQWFAHPDLAAIIAALTADSSDDAAATLKPIMRNAPLSMACTLELIERARASDSIETALGNEFRYTHRAQAQGDFLEGVRAQIIDKDRTPHWAHSSATDLTTAEVEAMLAPLGDQELDLKG